MTQLINSALSTTLTTYLSTELDSLADAGNYLGAAINNSSNRHVVLKAEIYLASVDLSAKTSPSVVIRLIESIDGGTNYEDNDDQSYGITIPVAATSAAHRKVSGDLYVPPGYFKLSVVNNTGAAFASSGNTLKYATYTPETSA